MNGQIISDNDLHNLVKTRWKNTVKRSFNLGVTGPNYKDYEDVLLENYKNGFTCGYCLRKLELNTSYPYVAAPSIDHKTPLSAGGTNAKENLFVCCNCCNIVKGTMSFLGFCKLLGALRLYCPDDFDGLMKEMLLGHLANKLKRLDNEVKSP